MSETELLEKASDEGPGILESIGAAVTGFAVGAYSWPFDYTLCLHWMAGTAGIYGSSMKATCDYHTQRILMILDAAKTAAYYLIFRGMLLDILGNPQGRQLTGEVLSNISPSRMAGRFASGAAFTAWMQSGGRIGAAASQGKRLGIVSFNFLAVSWGSAVHVSCKSPAGIDLVSIFVNWLTGDPNVRLSDDQYRALFSAAYEASQNALSDADRSDYENFRYVIEQLAHFARQGGKI